MLVAIPQVSTVHHSAYRHSFITNQSTWCQAPDSNFNSHHRQTSHLKNVYQSLVHFQSVHYDEVNNASNTNTRTILCIKHLSKYSNQLHNIYSLTTLTVVLHVSALPTPSSGRTRTLSFKPHTVVTQLVTMVITIVTS
jgi:hypothetical protein